MRSSEPGQIQKSQLSKVQVFLPRLKLEESYGLQSVLWSPEMIGVLEEAKANFSGMLTEKYVLKVECKHLAKASDAGREVAAVLWTA